MKNGELRNANDRLTHTKTRHKQKGITIVSLVITIILLLILAAISLQAITQTGLFEGAKQAKENEQLAQIEEQMKLTMTQMIAEKNGGKVTVEDYINNLADKGKVNVTDTYEEDGKQIVVVDDKYVFEVVDGEPYATVDKVGIKGKLPPVIMLESITGTTNSITVLVTTKRNEGGTIKFSIKQEGDSDYGSEVTKTETDASCTFTGLEQNKKYNIKILATAENEQTAELLVDKTLGSVPDLAKGDITFTYTVDGEVIDKETWTNKSVTVTASTEITGYTLQTSKDGKTWYDVRNQTFTENGQIYVALYDGTNYGGSATGNVTNIDTTKPIVTEATATTNSIAITATDEASGIVGYAITESSIEPSASSFIPVESTTSFSTTVTERVQGTTYYVWVKDAAGNISESKRTDTGNVPSLAEGNITFKYFVDGQEINKETWTNKNVTVTASTTIEGYTLQTKKENGSWSNETSQTFTENGKIYAVLYDGTNYGGSASGNVTNIDTTKPVVTGATATTNSIAITATDEASGIAGYAVTESGTKPSESDFTPVTLSTTSFSTTVTGKTQGTTYYVWVKDAAGNISASKSTITGTVTSGTTTGAITFGTTTWSGGKASTTISTNTSYTIQYQVNGISESGWTTGTSVTELVHGDQVYARLWDGINAGEASAAHNILDGIDPSASISLSATSTDTISSITAKVTHVDNESGINIANCKWVYNTTASKIGTNASSYSGKFSSNPQTITLSTTTAGTYYLHVLTTDIAGRKKETISNAVTVKTSNLVYLYKEGNQYTQITGGYNTFCRYSVAGAAGRKSWQCYL